MEGNQMKMREALFNIQEYAAGMDVDDGNVLAILDACRDALDAPPRQCDVGTPDEQSDRFAKHCIDKDCDSCEHGTRGRSLAHCALVWAQTPYAEKGAVE